MFQLRAVFSDNKRDFSCALTARMRYVVTLRLPELKVVLFHRDWKEETEACVAIVTKLLQSCQERVGQQN